MKRRLLLGGASIAIAALTAGSNAQAFVNGTGTCPLGTSDSFWGDGPKPLNILDGERFGPTRTFPQINSVNENTWEAATAAALWANSDWNDYVRAFGSFNFRMSANLNAVGDLFPWFDTGNERSELWWDDLDIGWGNDGPYGCPTDSMACTAWDHADCFLWGNNRLLAVDIAVDAVTPWAVVSQDSMAKCFVRTSQNMENTIAHEIGHGFGLDHHDGPISLMNSKPRVRNCRWAQGYRDAPMPDDVQGYLQYHKTYTGVLKNMSGTPWFRVFGQAFASGGTLGLNGPNGSLDVTFAYTLHSYYRHATGNYTVQYYAVPINQTPPFNWTTKRFTLPPALPVITVVTGSGTTEYSKTMAVTLPLIGTDIPSPGVYRIWVLVDSGYQITEVDDADNLFPTDVRIQRT